MFRRVLEQRTVFAMMIAMGVGALGVHAYPIDRGNVYLQLIELRSPAVFFVLVYGYATLWFTTPFFALSIFTSLATIVAYRYPAAERTRPLPTYEPPERRKSPMLVLGETHFEGGNEAVLEELVVDLGAKLRLLELGLRAGGGGFGGEDAAFDLYAEVGEFGLGGLKLGVGVGGGADDIGIAEDEDDAVGRDRGAGTENDFVHAALRARGDPGDLFGDERAEAAYLAEHLAAFHGVDPDEVALDGGRGGFEARKQHGDADQSDDGGGGVEDAFLALGFGLVGARDVHVVRCCFAAGVPASDLRN